MKWNLALLYASPTDSAIERDMAAIEKKCNEFASHFDTPQKKYLQEVKALAAALGEYEKLVPHLECKPLLYFHYLRSLEAANKAADSSIQLFSNRIAKAQNQIAFFEISIGTLPASKQKQFLNNRQLAPYKVLLERIFVDAKYTLSVPEEKILNLKALPAEEMWVAGNERQLNQLTVKWKGKTLPLPRADKMVHNLSNRKERYTLASLVNAQLKATASFAESEINAVYTDKKINDELRGYTAPYQSTVRSYRNDPEVVKKLIATVTEAFPISHRFYRLKAKLLKLKKLKYADRKIGMGKVKATFTFDDSLGILKKTFGAIDAKYADILDSYVKRGQIDVSPRVGKQGGAYCSGTYLNPTFVLLNHTDDMYSLSTFAHEMGHAFHTEASRSQGLLYCHYSTSLAETASTLFESIASEAVFESLSKKEQIIALHDKITDDIATIFRQVACFNFELDLHSAVRSKGFVPKEEIAELHNKNMKAYLGPLFDLTQDDGYFFVQWSHIRRFFYVYSYAYGQLVSKALLRRYREDKKFWTSIEKFLSAGGKASPEEILKEIGIDVYSQDFWKEGLKEIEEDIEKLEKLVN